MKAEHRTAEAFNTILEVDGCRAFTIDETSRGFVTALANLLIELCKDAAIRSADPEVWMMHQRTALFQAIDRCHPSDSAPADREIALDTVDLVTSAALHRLRAEGRRGAIDVDHSDAGKPTSLDASRSPKMQML